MITSYRTLRAPLRHEIAKVKGSRFLADAAPVQDAAAAQEVLERCRKGLFDASHHCWAWRLGRGDVRRWNDDGEPAGTAGKPILQEIDARKLTDVVVVVTRYFGGTKLGKGGLVRAYGEAAAAALDLAEIVEVELTAPLVLRYGYPQTSAVVAVLAAHGLDPRDAVYGREVELRLMVPVASVEALRRALIEATGNLLTFED